MIRIGTDMVRVSKVRNMVRSEFLGFQNLFTNEELKLADIVEHKDRFLASRFACKEAVFKCFDIKMKTVYLKEIETLKNERGRPYVRLHGSILEKYNKMKFTEIDISISYEDEYVIATAVLK